MAGDDYGAESGAPGLPAAPRPGPAPSRGAGGESASATAAPAAGIQNPLPAISLPKGGGAIRGIGEKFAANPVTGTGSMSVPIATSPGRSGFGPQLALSHDSGSGNGPFGVGWSLSTPAVSRKTDKGLPLYRDFEESDGFLLSGAEDLVPVLGDDGSRFVDEKTFPGYVIHRYRPRTEGLFARIERWSHLDSGEVHWRSISRDNVTTLYGKTAESRIADPDDPRRVFTWLICQSYDDKGNAIIYDYVGEDDANVNRFQANERNRVRTANRYLKRIRYGNRVSRLIEPDLGGAEWLFEVVFDYGEGHSQDLPLDPSVHEDAQHRYVRASHAAADSWPVRPDPFSSYRSGFEVRSYRRCHRVLMFHRFEELGQTPCLVRSTDFHYQDLDLSEPVAIDDELAHQGSTRFASLLRSVTQSGYVRQKDDEARYLKKSLPPVELEYSKAKIRDEVRELDPSSLENLPIGLDGADYQWVDLDGEGISGILTEQAGEWFYKRNLGAGRFAPQVLLPTRPSMAALGGGRQQLLDLAGDGQLDLVALADPAPGFYERTADGGWEPFRSIPYLPNVRWDDPNLRFVDLTGDGHADLLITEDDVFTWYPSLAEDGFGPARRAPRPQEDEQRGARLVMADGTQSIYLADMGGDGLNDLVRIRNGEVCYWPNTGYGRFGAKVTMDNGPWLDNPEVFNHERIRLADIDGSGTNDLIYLAPDGARIYFNQSGNRFSEARPLRAFPHTDHLASVTTADLLGNGTACLVWSSPLPGDVGRPLRYIDLMGGEKPHLLVNSKNNLGAETLVRYAPSTRFYLADKAAGKPWITKIPFPVHVVERVETYDHISGNRFVTRYAYHHGYFDGVEREFRGFGLVEQWDTEEFAALNTDGAFPTGTNIDESSHVPPVLTRTWFHTGVYLGRDRISKFFAGLLDATDKGEYFREPGLSYDEARALLLDDTVLPDGLSFDEAREVCRALRGSMLRQEVYARDGSAKEPFPYAVTEQNFTIKVLQSRVDNRHGVYFTHVREALSYHYERNPDDPRTTHALTLEVDDFGDVLKSASVGYGRRKPDAALEPRDQAVQAKVWTTYTDNAFTNAVEDRDAHRTPLAAEARTYELTGLRRVAGTERFAFAEMLAAGPAAAAISYEEEPTSGKLEKRVIEHVRTRYRSDNLERELPLGRLESMALTFESYKLALTPGLIAKVYGDRVTDTMLYEGGYVHSEGDANWWIPSGRVFHSSNPAADAATELSFAREHFFPHRFRDPFHTEAITTEAFVDYDRYDLLLHETRDALDNRVTIGERNVDPVQPPVRRGQDYRVLQPVLVMDPNRNRSEVAFDALGMVVGTAVMGKPEEDPVPGDRLTEEFRIDLTRAEIDEFLAEPRGVTAAQFLHGASTRIIYDLHIHLRDATQSAFAATLARETHASEPVLEGGLRVQVSFSYSDGFGREIQKKIPAEPGPVPSGDPSEEVKPRWVASGWTVFNNKGKPVRQYEPFFTARHAFEFNARFGVSPILFYDPLDRVTGTVHPNHTWDKVAFGPWRQDTWDVSDTVLATDPPTDPSVGNFFRRLPDSDYLPTWYTQRVDGALGKQEQLAARRSAIYAATPSIAHADSIGRTFLTVAHNRLQYSNTPVDARPVEEHYGTRVILNIEGNQQEVIDAKDRVVMRYDYDILGSRVGQASMEAGERWRLNDVTGKPIRAWDTRGFIRRTAYDQLRRPTTLCVDKEGVERLAERTIYGEAQDVEFNHRGRVHQMFDGAGIVTSVSYDFKGNSLEVRRDLLPGYRDRVDWQSSPAADNGSFTGFSRYDALNRLSGGTSPDGSVHRVIFNEAGLLDAVHVSLRGAAEPTPFVTNINYDAKGRRERIDYANGASTTYSYDRLTSYLIHLRTTRPEVSDATASHLLGTPTVVQDVYYTYDAVGNLIEVRDSAHKTVFHSGQPIEPVSRYTYDALYRLIEAQGREHIGQTALALGHAADDRRDHPFAGHGAHPNDLQALRNSTDRYQYDQVGNIVSHQHVAAGGSWTRGYDYSEPSLLVTGDMSNSLTRTIIGSDNQHVEAYRHDAHGSVTAMGHLPELVWDFENQLQQVDLGGATAYYVYDTSGQRVRKVIENRHGTRLRERIYLSGFEVYREFHGDETSHERASLSVMDDKARVVVADIQTIDQGQKVETSSPALRYQLSNHLGSVSLELDAAGAVISYEEYHPYGIASFQAGRSVAEVSLKRYRYMGKERDEETGFIYYGARYYAPWLGRWTATEPRGLQDGTNLYVFVQNQPLTNAEIDGFGWRDVAWGFAKGVAAGVVIGALIATAPISAPAAAIIGVAGALGAGATVAATHLDHKNGFINDEQRDEAYGSVAGGFVGGGIGGRLGPGAKQAAANLLGKIELPTFTPPGELVPAFVGVPSSGGSGAAVAVPTTGTIAPPAVLSPPVATSVGAAVSAPMAMALTGSGGGSSGSGGGPSPGIKPEGKQPGARKPEGEKSESTNTQGSRAAAVSSSKELTRGQILSQVDEALAPLAERFPDAEVGVRGSIPRGTKGPHKDNAPFDPNNFDVDAFIVSDKLAGLVPQNGAGFRNLARLPEFQGLVRSAGEAVQRIPGVRAETFRVRVFTRQEFEATVGANERHFVRQ